MYSGFEDGPRLLFGQHPSHQAQCNNHYLYSYITWSFGKYEPGTCAYQLRVYKQMLTDVRFAEGRYTFYNCFVNRVFSSFLARIIEIFYALENDLESSKEEKVTQTQMYLR